SVSVKGFRAYGATEQKLTVSPTLAAIWGPNSKGKSSLADAIEFALTGRINRREILGSTQDEFAGALRNVHLDDADDVYVSIEIVMADGTLRCIKRTLTDDYAKR